MQKLTRSSFDARARDLRHNALQVLAADPAFAQIEYELQDGLHIQLPLRRIAQAGQQPPPRVCFDGAKRRVILCGIIVGVTAAASSSSIDLAPVW